jgi:hypothetical protein
MHQTVEAILHPDGRVELLEPVAATKRRRALVTILEDAPLATVTLPETLSEADRVDAALFAAGLFDNTDDLARDAKLLSEEERAALAMRIQPGTPLSQIIHEEREERF